MEGKTVPAQLKAEVKIAVCEWDCEGLWLAKAFVVSLSVVEGKWEDTSEE